jgi:hypothetical protein
MTVRKIPEDPKDAFELGYEQGYKDGGNDVLADFHTDNPDTVRMAYKLIGEVIEEHFNG